MIAVGVAVAFFIVTIVLAHFLAPSEYNWKLNTVSDLGSQKYKNAWLMRTGFIGFGVLLSTALLPPFIYAEEKNYSDLPIVIYALNVLLTGVFSAAPFTHSSIFSVVEDKLHSLFAQIAGIAFSCGVFWHSSIYSDPNQKITNFVLFAFIIGFSALIGLSKKRIIKIGLGLLQRGLYLVSFLWLLFRYT
ncbi:MAG: DUF998 domain-containing protein [Oscillatoriales cyanobacterium RU_3_3]|nr:DUF998 domain-containing protein [Microcoleus sp. SU_5_6]NJL68991.1 DUF998 domain-containing protein [Microcoleus sp. SM1_3_4]NJM64012.1 DUF998 domain-containing protein [Oscillatoriales cyanobacterium RU_3_3]NJR23602.1 DUF998 domain-containing protein [Richelia sp. CSU_2_1]